MVTPPPSHTSKAPREKKTKKPAERHCLPRSHGNFTINTCPVHSKFYAWSTTQKKFKLGQLKPPNLTAKDKKAKTEEYKCDTSLMQNAILVIFMKFRLQVSKYLKLNNEHTDSIYAEPSRDRHRCRNKYTGRPRFILAD